MADSKKFNNIIFKSESLKNGLTPRMYGLLDVMDKHGIKVRVTSGKRQTTTKRGTKSNHWFGDALDVTPHGDETWDSMLQKIRENEEVKNYFVNSGIGIYDERKDRGEKGYTGSHFHIGPDKVALREFDKLIGGNPVSSSTSSVSSNIDPVNSLDSLSATNIPAKSDLLKPLEFSSPISNRDNTPILDMDLSYMDNISNDNYAVSEVLPKRIQEENVLTPREEYMSNDELIAFNNILKENENRKREFKMIEDLILGLNFGFAEY